MAIHLPLLKYQKTMRLKRLKYLEMRSGIDAYLSPGVKGSPHESLCGLTKHTDSGHGVLLIPHTLQGYHHHWGPGQARNQSMWKQGPPDHLKEAHRWKQVLPTVVQWWKPQVITRTKMLLVSKNGKEFPQVHYSETSRTEIPLCNIFSFDFFKDCLFYIKYRNNRVGWWEILQLLIHPPNGCSQVKSRSQKLHPNLSDGW